MTSEKGPKDIVICTNIDTIKDEIIENFDPEHEDFWPVANYPKDIEVGKSRLHLSANGEFVVSFLIKDKAEREWKGEQKKVLLLEKRSAKLEDFIINDQCAAMGGYRYLTKKGEIKGE